MVPGTSVPPAASSSSTGFPKDRPCGRFRAGRGIRPKTAFLAQGRVAAFTGWPSLVGEFTGEAFRGLPPTNGPVEQTIMDFHIRRGGRLAVNWVLMDLIKFAADCGIDLMAKLRHPSGGS